MIVEKMGFNNRVLKWLEAFLTGRGQRVVVNGKSSSREQVTSGIPQGSVMGPVLFVLFINDAPDGILSRLYIFADDTKMFRRIQTVQDTLILQDDTDRMDDWSEDALMVYNAGKCTSMSICLTGQPRIQGTYSIANNTITVVEEEKDLGVTVDNHMTFDSHIRKKTDTANKVMGIIRRSYTHLSASNFPYLFKGLVRPHLEYAQSAWQPHLRRQIDDLEKVQRRATKQVQGLGNMTYPERLHRLKLTTLEYRRLRGDMMEVYKILHHEYDPMASQNLLHRSTNHRTRGHEYKLEKERCRRDIRLHAFGNRVVNSWNSLPAEVVQAPTLKTFKARLDRHWQNHELKYKVT